MLQDKTGWFSVSSNKSGREWPIFFDRTAATTPGCYDAHVINFGNVMSGCDLNANLFEQWFEETPS